MDVKGLLNGTPMNISGTINPFESKLKLAMKGEVTSLSLPAFSPFSAKFTGHPIEKGLLTYKGAFDINQDKLTSENALVINKLEFGSQVPDAKDAFTGRLGGFSSAGSSGTDRFEYSGLGLLR